MSIDNLYQKEKDFFEEKGFGVKLGFGKKPALVVVDIIRAFTDPKKLLGTDMAEVIEQTNKVIDACRQAGAPIYFTTTGYHDESLSDGGVWVLKLKKGASDLRLGTSNVEQDPRLHYVPEDDVIVKKYASCFFGTDLTSRLVSRGCDTVLIVGATTSGCVRATAVDAVQSGFRPIVIEEAVADRSETAHKQSLFDIEAKYGDVVSVEDVQNYLKAFSNV